MTALKNEPENVMAMYNLALAHERCGQYRTALEWVRRARSRDAGDIALQRLEFRLKIFAFKRRVEAVIRRHTRWLRAW
jgi:hypothetical protein